ncbi:MAG: c-type cytochrome [Spirulinaceae cyanobacterium]
MTYIKERKALLKKVLSFIWLGVALFCLAWANPAYAGDAAKGAQIFSANCAACHMGGRNVINGAKTLNKGDLEKYGMYSEEAIITQVTNGKMAMPAFRGKLSAEQIENVAAYVLDKADQGW